MTFGGQFPATGREPPFAKQVLCKAVTRNKYVNSGRRIAPHGMAHLRHTSQWIEPIEPCNYRHITWLWR
jgi:hypothetical protein